MTVVVIRVAIILLRFFKIFLIFTLCKMFLCEKCKKSFKTENGYNKHLGKIYPCDNVCLRCHGKYRSRQSFEQHVSKCKPKLFSEEQIQHIQQVSQTNINVQNTIAKITNNRIGTNIGIVGDNGNQNNISLALNVKLDKPDKTYMMLHGITPHGLEIGKLYGIHYKSISKLVVSYLQENKLGNNHDPRALEVLVIQLVQMFYSNEKYPEYINIKDDEPQGDRNKVYSGSEFIPDVMPKHIRNRRILQILLSILKQHVEDGRNGVQWIRDFIRDNLIPHIINVYLRDGYHETLQYVWGNNSEIVKQLRLEVQEVPDFEDLRDGHYDNIVALRDQINKYMIEDTNIIQESIQYRACDKTVMHGLLDEHIAAEKKKTNPVKQFLENGSANGPRVEEPNDVDESTNGEQTPPQNENRIESVEERMENKRLEILASAGLSKVPRL